MLAQHSARGIQVGYDKHRCLVWSVFAGVMADMYLYCKVTHFQKIK